MKKEFDENNTDLKDKLRKVTNPKPLLSDLPDTLKDARDCFFCMVNFLCKNGQDITIMGDSKAYRMLQKEHSARESMFEL